jgi:hypothetical protein
VQAQRLAEDDEVEYAEERASAQGALAVRLNLAVNSEALLLLHRAVAELSPLVQVLSPAGDGFDGLFNSFTVDTMWRRPAG